MKIKKMVVVCDNMEDYSLYINRYKDTEWTILTEHSYLNPFKGTYVSTYIIIYAQEEVEE